MPDHLLWLDLETTGDDETEDSIIEVGCVLTDTSLDERGSFQSLVRPTNVALRRMRSNEVVLAMHTANGLLDELLTVTVQGEILAWLKGNGAKPKATMLAGSGVGHFDLRFLRRHMPGLAAFLEYGPLDIGSVRRAHRLFVGTDVSGANDAKTHRALDDARCHLAEARAYRDLWRAALLAPAER